MPEDGQGGALRVRTDGASRGNPGHAGIGVVIERVADGTVVEEIAQYLGEATNNIAEYRALLAALGRALQLGATAVEVVSDSELLVRQMEGRYQVRHPGILPLYQEAVRLRRRFPGGFRIQHTLRGGNRRADELANEAIDRALGRTPAPRPAPPAPAPPAAAAVPTVADAFMDVFALGASLQAGQAVELGGGVRLARVRPGQTRVSGWVMLLRGTVLVGERELQPGQSWRGGARYRAAGDEDALALETDSVT